MSDVRRVLSIDGGGIRGALPIGFLARVEEITGQRVVDQFDLIAGTSTGGIIAIGLGLGLPAADILAFYRERGPAIFGDRSPPLSAGVFGRLMAALGNEAGRGSRRLKRILAPKHDSRALREPLDGVLGDRLLGESLTRLLIPAHHPDRRTVYVFKTSHHERFEVDHRWKAADVAMATASAPTYFAAHTLPSGARLVDGGIWANNPMGLAVVEAIGVLGWEPSRLRILSLGCGDDVYVPNLDGGLAHLGLDASSLFIQGQSFAAYGAAKILAGEKNVHRIDPAVPKNLFSLDDVTKVDRLAGMGAECARDALPMLRREFLVGRREEFIPFHGCRSASVAAARVGTGLENPPT